MNNWTNNSCLERYVLDKGVIFFNTTDLVIGKGTDTKPILDLFFSNQEIQSYKKKNITIMFEKLLWTDT